MSTSPTYPDVAIPPGQEIGLNVQAASPPISAYAGKDDTLFILTSVASGSPLITVAARLLMPDGTVKPNVWSFTPNTQRAALYTPITLPECFILSLSITCILTGTTRPVYAQALLFRGQTGGTGAAQVLCSGYLTQNVALSWPSGYNTDNVNCVGSIRSITGTTPAAGANISESVPANAKWRFIAMTFTLVTSVAVANRVVLVQFGAAGLPFVNCGPSTVQAASISNPYMVGAGLLNLPASSLVINIAVPLSILLTAGQTITTAVANIQAADQLSAPQYEVEEWLIP